MKKLALIFSIIGLTSCAGSNTVNMATSSPTLNSIGSAIFQTAVNQKCQSEIKNNQYYNMASIIMTDSQKEKVVGNVCGCVSKKAPESVTLSEIATATVDANARPKIITKAVAKTLQACVADFIKQ